MVKQQLDSGYCRGYIHCICKLYFEKWKGFQIRSVSLSLLSRMFRRRQFELVHDYKKLSARPYSYNYRKKAMREQGKSGTIYGTLG